MVEITAETLIGVGASIFLFLFGLGVKFLYDISVSMDSIDNNISRIEENTRETMQLMNRMDERTSNFANLAGLSREPNGGDVQSNHSDNEESSEATGEAINSPPEFFHEMSAESFDESFTTVGPERKKVVEKATKIPSKPSYLSEEKLYHIGQILDKKIKENPPTNKEEMIDIWYEVIPEVAREHEESTSTSQEESREVVREGIGKPKESDNEFQRSYPKIVAWAVDVPVTKRHRAIIQTLLEKGPLRFNELNANLNGISKKELTDILDDLIEKGMVDRQVDGEAPQSVKYELTPHGRDLQQAIRALAELCYEYITSASAPDDPGDQ